MYQYQVTLKKLKESPEQYMSVEEAVNKAYEIVERSQAAKRIEKQCRLIR